MDAVRRKIVRQARTKASRLSHLLLVFALEMVFTVVGFTLLLQRGLEVSRPAYLAALLAAVIAAAILAAGPVARVFRLPPLMFLSGPCPRCGLRPNGWWKRNADKRRLLLACSHCGQVVELWLAGAPSRTVSPGIPSDVLRWPTFLGIWRSLEATPPGRI